MQKDALRCVIDSDLRCGVIEGETRQGHGYSRLREKSAVKVWLQSGHSNCAG